MESKVVYLSCHRGDDAYQKKVDSLVRGLMIDGLSDIRSVGMRGDAVGWKVTDENIRKAIVLFLITDGWYVHCRYEFELTLYHKRPFIVVYCKPGVHMPESYPQS